MTNSSTQSTGLEIRAVDPNHDIRVQRAQDYPQQIWIFLCSFIVLLALFRFGALFVFWRRKRRACLLIRSAKEKTSTQEELAGSVYNRKVSLRRIPLAIVNTFRILAYRVTLSVVGDSVLNGAEVGLIVGYIIALFTWEFINCMNVTTGVKFDANYWSNRAANIVATQLPLIVALAGKNNLISFVTGISYEKLNVLHRAAARICLVLVWVHFWGRVKLGLTDTLTTSHPWVRTGISVATAYTTLVLISLRPIRRRFYEFFFFSHVFLVLMILIGAYFHIHKGTGFGPYLVPSFVFWALDRTLRFIRVLRNNRLLSAASRWSTTSLEATAELISPDMVRLVLSRNMTWRPGQSAFITMPFVSHLPFESHPFTIASIPHHEDRDVLPPDSPVEDFEDLKRSGAIGNNELVFLIRARDGFTRRLRDTVQCQRGKASVVSFSALVDGPYGCPPDLNAFETVILIAGGSGVSYTLSLLLDIIRNARTQRTACRNLVFLWAVPHLENLSWISHTLHEALDTSPSSIRVRIHVYVTQNRIDDSRGSAEGSLNSGEHNDPFAERLLQKGWMRVEIGRPNVQALLEDEFTYAKGPVSVDVAGPAGLAAAVRSVLCSDIAGPKAILKGRPDITLHVETYGIA